ncbi:unnamed protein product [Closterium sp. NIES-53]
MNAPTTRSLAYNQLSGPIPTSIGSLATLTYLDLHSNSLSGSIPPSIASLSLLNALWPRPSMPFVALPLSRTPHYHNHPPMHPSAPDSCSPPLFLSFPCSSSALHACLSVTFQTTIFQGASLRP